MPKLDELRKKYDDLKGQMHGLREKAKADDDRDLTDDESGQLNAWLDEGHKVIAEIRAIEDRNARDERLGQFEAFANEPQRRLTAPVNPNPPATAPIQATSATTSSATGATITTSGSNPNEWQCNPTITGGPDSSKFAGLGEQLYAVRRAEIDRIVDPRLRFANPADSPQAAASGLNETTPSAGGFLVQQDTMSELFQRAYESAAILNRIRTITLGQPFNGLKINGIDETSRAAGSRWGGVQGYWKEEAGTPTASQPSFRQISLDLKKLMALYYATDEVLADTVALESVVSQAVAAEIQFMLEDSIINGTGAGQPLGILNSGCLVSVTEETGQEANTFIYENVVKMWARMWARSRPNAVWLINQAVEPQLFTMSLAVGTGGLPVYLPPGGASAAPYGSLFGRPVIPVEYCAALGTAGDVILADLSQYVGIDKGGLETASSMHVRFLYAEMAYRFIFRFDGQPLWNSALTPFKGSDTLSPFVVTAASTTR